MIYIILFNSSTLQIIEKEIVFGDKNTKIEVRRIKEFQRYEFWVTASTVVGEGQPSFRVNQSPNSRGKKYTNSLK